MASTLTIPTGFLLALSEVRTIEDAISAFADWGPQATGADRCSIALINRKEDALTLLAVSGTKNIAQHTVYPVRDTLLGAVYQRREPVIIPDIKGIHAPGLVILDREGYKSSGLAPLTVGGQCFGVLSASYKDRREVSDPVWTVLIVMAGCLSMQIALLSQRDDMANLALHDQLTGLPNRHQFTAVMREIWRRKVELGQIFSLIMIDIDHFKGINDRHGHATGDTILQMVATCLLDHVPEEALVARIGGEEFLVALPNVHQHDAARLAEHCRKALQEEPMAHDGQLIELTCCFGVAEVSDHDATPQDTINRADRAMYQAKNTGRNKVACASKPAAATG